MGVSFSYCRGGKRLFLFNCSGDDVDEHPIGEFAGEIPHLACLKFHRAGYQSEERIVFATLHILARVVFGAALADNDVAHFHCLTAVYFHTETLGNRITA